MEDRIIIKALKAVIASAGFGVIILLLILAHRHWESLAQFLFFDAVVACALAMIVAAVVCLFVPAIPRFLNKMWGRLYQAVKTLVRRRKLWKELERDCYFLPRSNNSYEFLRDWKYRWGSGNRTKRVVWGTQASWIQRMWKRTLMRVQKRG